MCGELRRKMRASLSVVTMTASQKLYDASEMATRTRTLIPSASYEVNS